MNIRSASVLAVGIAMAITPAQASLVTFSGYDAGAGQGAAHPNSTTAATAFAAATPGGATVNFEGFTSPGITFHGGIINDMPSGNPTNLYGFNITAGGSDYYGVNGGPINLTFQSPIQAFGAYFTGVQMPLTLIVSDSSGEHQLSVPYSATAGTAFLGFTDFGESITGFFFTGSNDIYGIDDVRYLASATAAPEPAGWATTMLGLGLAGALARRRAAGKPATA